MNRNHHLVYEHGKPKGSVRYYFVSPEDYGISVKEFEKIPEGSKVIW